ncbi:hypothetical protein JTB14_020834 [Gonioctena quinquepunctata]|nr:hypothetical protein JTB14_020834 [Gonioctena quinquepunctata]
MALEYFQPITTEEETEIWKSINTTNDRAEEDIGIIRTWLNSQPHLPYTLSDKQIIGFLLIGKGSIEKIKSKIDMYFTMRTLYPDIFTESHPHSDRILNASKFLYILPLPKMDRNCDRIILLKLKDMNPADLDANACFALLLNMVDIRLLDDFCKGTIIIFDMGYCKLGHVAKATPIFMKNIYTIAEVST